MEKLKMEILEAFEGVIRKRFERVRERPFAPFRALRYSLMLRRLRRASKIAKEIS